MSDLIFNAKIETPRTAITDTDTITGAKFFLSLSTQESNMIRSNSLMNIFFRRDDLEDLLKQTDCKGLRFYPAFDSEGRPSLLAVGIDRGATDLVRKNFPKRESKVEDKCFISEGRDRNATNIKVENGEQILRTLGNIILTAEKNGINREAINPLANSAMSSGKSYSKVMFTASTIDSMLENPEVIGIQFYTTKIQFTDDKNNYKTLAAAPVSDTTEGDMFLSALPCPPNCAGGYVEK